MHLLIGWDDPAQADLILLYLGSSGHTAEIAVTPAAFTAALANGPFDLILLSTRLPDPDAAFTAFREARSLWPDTPVVGGCPQGEVFRVARFLLDGMRTYLLRDEQGDFVFLLQAMLEGVLEGVRAERERQLAARLREEIDGVRRVQESIIPRRPAGPPGYRLAARYEPSQIRVIGGRPVALAGGDYYDVFPLDENRTVVLLGDASGHGMKACLSIMTMHTLIRMLRGEAYRDTAAFVAEINRRVCEQSIISDDGGFITLLFGVLRSDTHEFVWTSAGHPAPLQHDLSTDLVLPLGMTDDGGLPLGILPDADYTTSVCTLDPGTRLLIYTDGLEEAFPAGGDRHSSFGRTGIASSLRRTRRGTPADALTALFSDSETFTAGSGRHDDTSALLIEREPVPASPGTPPARPNTAVLV